MGRALSPVPRDRSLSPRSKEVQREMQVARESRRGDRKGIIFCIYVRACANFLVCLCLCPPSTTACAYTRVVSISSGLTCIFSGQTNGDETFLKGGVTGASALLDPMIVTYRQHCAQCWVGRAAQDEEAGGEDLVGQGAAGQVLTTGRLLALGEDNVLQCLLLDVSVRMGIQTRLRVVVEIYYYMYTYIYITRIYTHILKTSAYIPCIGRKHLKLPQRRRVKILFAANFL